MSKKIGNRYSPVWAFPEKEFIDIVNNSFSFNSIVKKIGLNNGGFCNTVRNRIKKLGINISHFNKKKAYEDWKKKKKKFSLEDILIKNSEYKGSGKNLKNILYNNKIKEEKCEICLLGNIWNGKKITLQIDHINGNHQDNRIQNLRILCPNCHSQTDTFCAKNINKNKLTGETPKEVKELNCMTKF